MMLNDYKNITSEYVLTKKNMLIVRQPTRLIYTTHLSWTSNAIKWTSRSNGRDNLQVYSLQGVPI